MSEAQKAHKSAATLSASDVFDEAYYRRRYSDIGDEDAFHHFMTIGGWEGRKCSDRFDAGWYLVNYDDVATQGVHPLDHYLGVGIHEKRKTGLTDHQIKLLHRLVDQFREIDPEIRYEAQFKFLDRMFYARGAEGTRTRDCWKKIFASLAKPYNRLVFTGQMNGRGSTVAAVNAMEAVASAGKLSDTLLVQTDFTDGDTALSLAAGTNALSFSDFDAELSHEERIELVEYLIAALQPEAVMNIDSAACWDAFRRRGAALSQFANLFVCVFHETVYDDTLLHSCFPHLSKIYTDNVKSAQEFAEQHRLNDRSQFEFIGEREAASRKPTWPQMKAAFTAASNFLSSNASLKP